MTKQENRRHKTVDCRMRNNQPSKSERAKLACFHPFTDSAWRQINLHQMFFMQGSLFWNKSNVVSGNTYPENCHFRTLKFRPTTMYRYWRTFYRALWIAVSFVRKSRMRSRVFIRLNVFPSPGRKLLINVNRLRWIIFTKPAFQISFFRNTEPWLACCVLTRHDHPAADSSVLQNYHIPRLWFVSFYESKKWHK